MKTLNTLSDAELLHTTRLHVQDFMESKRRRTGTENQVALL